jgi:AcrR family transcriptional regulator
MPSDSRRQMVVSAATLLRERGLAGTSFREVLEHSGAPRGSIYHHFPGGKSQLVEEAVTTVGDYASRLIASAHAGDPIAALRAFVQTWRVVLESSDYRAGCPVVAVVTEASEQEPELRRAAAEAFTSWQRELAAVLREAGVPADRARSVAALVVGGVEGAVVLCRAQRGIGPLEDVGAELELVLGSVLAPGAEGALATPDEGPTGTAGPS